MEEHSLTENASAFETKKGLAVSRSDTVDSWVGNLSNLYEEELEDVLLARSMVRPEYRRYDNDKGITSMGEFSYAFLDVRGKGEGVRLRELIEKPLLDYHKGASLTSDTVVAVGRKL